MDERIDPCPSCGAQEWDDDWIFNGEEEVPVTYCGKCDWPPPLPMSPEEWRAHGNNPLNGGSLIGKW